MATPAAHGAHGAPDTRKAPWKRRGSAARRRGADGGGGRRRARLGRSSIRRHPHGERSSARPAAAPCRGRAERAAGLGRGSVADPSGPGRVRAAGPGSDLWPVPGASVSQSTGRCRLRAPPGPRQDSGPVSPAPGGRLALGFLPASASGRGGGPEQLRALQSPSMKRRRQGRVTARGSRGLP